MLLSHEANLFGVMDTHRTSHVLLTDIHAFLIKCLQVLVKLHDKSLGQFCENSQTIVLVNILICENDTYQTST